MGNTFNIISANIQVQQYEVSLPCNTNDPYCYGQNTTSVSPFPLGFKSSSEEAISYGDTFFGSDYYLDVPLVTVPGSSQIATGNLQLELRVTFDASYNVVGVTLVDVLPSFQPMGKTQQTRGQWTGRYVSLSGTVVISSPPGLPNTSLAVSYRSPNPPPLISEEEAPSRDNDQR